MKQHLNISDRTCYRYLKNRDHFEFHLEVFKIFYKETDAAKHLQVSLQHLLYAAFSKQTSEDANVHYQTHQELIMLVELAHILAQDREDLEYILHGELISERQLIENPCKVQQNVHAKDNQSLHYEQECPRIFFSSFYERKSLKEWRGIVDELLHLATGHHPHNSNQSFALTDVLSFQSDILKLIDAMHVVYSRTSLHHVKLHHPSKLYLKTSSIQSSSIGLFPIENLEQIIQLIAQALQPEAIYCVNRQQLACGAQYADLVLVIPDSHNISYTQMEQVMEFALSATQYLSFSIYKSRPFRGMLSVGHVYYSLACDENNLLYKAYDYKPLSKPSVADDRADKITKQYYNGQDKARDFLASAALAKTENLAFATYMLHQAAELNIRALNRAICGEQKPTHSISKLLEVSKRISADLSLCMLDGSARSEELLELLDASYLDFRYKDNYEVGVEQFEDLFIKAESLLETCERTFIRWINRYIALFKLPKT